MNDNPQAIEVIYEDNHMAVAVKPAGLLTQASGTTEDNLEDRLRQYIKTSRNKPGEAWVNAVHRIDRVTSGLVVFALTSKAAARLQAAAAQSSAGGFQKTYLAWVEGQCPPGEKLHHYLKHGHKKSDCFTEPGDGRKEARLVYRTLKQAGQTSLLEVELLTGRYHQIRNQLAFCGHPVLGDRLYGSQTDWPAGIALHHARLELLHPVKKEKMVFETDPVWPAGFAV